MSAQIVSPGPRILHLPPRPTAPAGVPGVEVIHDSQALLAGHREVVIRHGDRCYRLRHTSNDKLILTK